jgi:hypothetical protein
MASFTAGTTFVDGVSNDVTAAKLGALVTNATPTSGFIQDRTAEAIIATNDTLLIGDTSDSSNLKRITVANFAQTLPTAKVTTGTIETGTFGTTTSTAATITTGTITTGVIPTLTTGTTTSTNEVVTNGTITNLSATTSTFLGTITGSTNVINIGSGQIYKDASGQVGIGTSTLAGKLHVKVATDQNFVTQGSVQIAGSVALSAVNDAVTENVPLEFRYKTNLGFFDNGTERMRIASGGNVGIGIASPDTKLHIDSGSSTLPLIQVSANSGSPSYFGGANSLFTGGGTTDLGIFSSNKIMLGGAGSPTATITGGNVGIGIASPAEALHVSVAGGNNFAGIRSQNNNAGTGIGGIEFSSDATYSKAAIGLLRENFNGVGNIVFYNSSSTGAADWSTSDERMRISSSGELILAGSTAQKATGTTWSNPSDVRIKKNIRDYEKGLTSLMQVRVREWEYNGKAGTVNDSKNIGVVADEIENVLPDTVSTYTAKLNEGDENDSQIKKFDASEVTWLLVKSLQELKAENDSLKSRIEALEAK